MSKSIRVALMNRFPGGRVVSSESSILAYDSAGNLRVAVSKNGNGDWVDAQGEHGASDALDLSPIPKGCRFMKLHKDGRVAPSEEHDERKAAALALAGKHGRKVPSEAELAAAPKEAPKAQA
ncbi:MAG: hypothetical protein NDJ89_09580 [Oligoflexia bacterium]|nr:hypothetical protein [Oligoflexia bacterium]